MLTKSLRYMAISYAIFYNQVMGPLKIIEIFRVIEREHWLKLKTTIRPVC